VALRPGDAASLNPVPLQPCNKGIDNKPAGYRNNHMNKTNTPSEIKAALAAINTLRDLGYAVVLFNPYDLSGVNPVDVEEEMRASGDHYIDIHQQ
jgi:hypothetical protein